jgi:hypothetical protein
MEKELDWIFTIAKLGTQIALARMESIPRQLPLAPPLFTIACLVFARKRETLPTTLFPNKYAETLQTI